MMRDREHQREKLREQLSAYLDGQLNAEEAQRIADALAKDADLQAEFESLRETRDWVRQLPRESAPAGMLEAILQQAERERLLPSSAEVRPHAHTHWLRHLATAAMLAVVGGAGFYIYSLTTKHAPIAIESGRSRVASRAVEKTGEPILAKGSPSGRGAVAPAAPTAAVPPVASIAAKQAPAIADKPATAEHYEDGTLYGQRVGGQKQIVLNSRDPRQTRRDVSDALASLGVQMANEEGPSQAAAQLMRRGNFAYVNEESPSKSEIVTYLDRDSADKLAEQLEAKERPVAVAAAAPALLPSADAAGSGGPMPEPAFELRSHAAPEPALTTLPTTRATQPSVSATQAATVGNLTRVVITINAARPADSQPATRPASQPASRPASRPAESQPGE